MTMRCRTPRASISISPRLAVKDERHGDDGLERVALRAARRGDVGLAAADPDGEVEDVLDGLRRDAGAVVRHRDSGLVDRDGDRRRDAGLLAGVDAVVDQLLKDDERPCLAPVTGLRDQLLLAREVEQSRRAKGGALEDRRLAVAHGATPFRDRPVMASPDRP